MGNTLKGALRVSFTFHRASPLLAVPKSSPAFRYLRGRKAFTLPAWECTVLGAGTFLGCAIKMKFTAGTSAEALEQTHPQPDTRRDAPSGDGQRFGNWWNWRAAAVPARGRLGVAKPPRDGERSPARLKIPFPPHCAGSCVGPAPSAKQIPLITGEPAALQTSCDQDLMPQDGKVRQSFRLLTWAWEGRGVVVKGADCVWILRLKRDNLGKGREERR